MPLPVSPLEAPEPGDTSDVTKGMQGGSGRALMQGCSLCAAVEAPDLGGLVLVPSPPKAA